MASTIRTRMLYKSLPLLGRKIRLLKILSTEPRIVCKLSIAELNPELRFNALSYVWGNPLDTETITVNELALPVTKNLAIALRSAYEHLKPFEKERLPVWADAICIDQADNDEKSSQVPLMREIYSMADVVLCSLGRPQQTTVDAMACIKAIAHERISNNADVEDPEVRRQLLNRNETLCNSIATSGKLCELSGHNHSTTQSYSQWLNGLSPIAAVTETCKIADLCSGAEAQALQHEMQNFTSYISDLLNDPHKILPGSAKTVQLSQVCSIDCSTFASLLQQGVNSTFESLPALSREASHEHYRRAKTFVNQICKKADELQSLFLRLQRHASDKGRIPNISWLREHAGMLRTMPENGWPRSGLSLIGEMMHQQYWSRVWTFQEIVLSRQPIFVCGSQQLDWRSLCSLIYWTEWIQDFGTDKRPEWISHEEWALLTNAFTSSIERLRSAARARVRVRNLGWMEDTNNVPTSENIPEENIKFWYVSATLQATDPRDHYYGFLGINPINLTPDYSKTIGQVAIDFLVQHVTAHRERSPEAQGAFSEFKPLDWAGIGHGWFVDSSTPSWAPNYSGFARGSIKADEPPGTPIMQMSNSVDDEAFRAWPKAIFNGSIMQVPGIIIEDISSIGPRRPQFVETSDEKTEQAISWIIDLSMRRDNYVTGCHMLDAVYWALQYTTIRPLNLENGEIYKDGPGGKLHLALFLLSKIRDRNERSGTRNERCWAQRFEYLNTLDGKSKLSLEEYHEVIIDMLGVCSRSENRLAETRSGYIGLFPKDLRRGDMVCIVNGFRQPVLLRQVEKHYLFVGTCVIRGLQDEEEVGMILARKSLYPEMIEIW